MPSVENSRDVAVLRELYESLYLFGSKLDNTDCRDGIEASQLLNRIIPNNITDLEGPVAFGDKRRVISKILDYLAEAENMIYNYDPSLPYFTRSSAK